MDQCCLSFYEILCFSDHLNCGLFAVQIAYISKWLKYQQILLEQCANNHCSINQQPCLCVKILSLEPHGCELKSWLAQSKHSRLYTLAYLLSIIFNCKMWIIYYLISTLLKIAKNNVHKKANMQLISKSVFAFLFSSFPFHYPHLFFVCLFVSFLLSKI